MKIPIGPEVPDLVHAVTEIPKGAQNKYEFSPEWGAFFLDRVLFSPVRYPANYGFIPETLGADGDALDILVLVEEPTFPGCVLKVRPIGVLSMRDAEQLDEKILGAFVGDPRLAGIHEPEDLPAHTVREFEYFFSIYKDLEGRPTQTFGWKGSEEAKKTILASHRRYLARKGARARGRRVERKKGARRP